MLENQLMGEKPHKVVNKIKLLIWYKIDFNTQSLWRIHCIMMKTSVTQKAVTSLYLFTCNKKASIYIYKP